MRYPNKIILLFILIISFFPQNAVPQAVSASTTVMKSEAETPIKSDIHIHDIQGEGHTSPLVGEVVSNVEGIVTYQYTVGHANYFHMQTPESDYDGNTNTSEGIIVYTGDQVNVTTGDRVHVTGKVNEYYINGYRDKEETDLSVTQINARHDQSGNVSVLESNVALPAPIQLTSSDIPDVIMHEDGFTTFHPENAALDFWESLEGMRVEIAPSKAIAPQEHDEVIVVTNEYPTDTTNGGIHLNEGTPNAQTIHIKPHPEDDANTFPANTGDEFTQPITGVVNYEYATFKVFAEPDEVGAGYTEGGSEATESGIETDADQLTIASYNIENFSANASEQETPDDKASNLAHSITRDLKSPDIVAVIEMQDNNGGQEGPSNADASESFERLIREIENAGGPSYHYLNINPEYNEDGGAPHSNIRTGYLYNPDRVRAKKPLATEEAPCPADNGNCPSIPVEYEKGALNMNPGRIDPTNPVLNHTRKSLVAQFEFQGESVVVIANHLNARIIDDPPFGQNQPPEERSSEQRTEIARILNGFVRIIEADNPDENIVVLGDMNDHPFSAPLQTLAGDELTNLIEKVPKEKRYSYVHEGNSQVLDHILVSNHLEGKADIDIPHINADFSGAHGRASDHDPVLVQLDLRSEMSDAGIDGVEGSPSDKREQEHAVDQKVVYAALLFSGITIILTLITVMSRRK